MRVRLLTGLVYGVFAWCGPACAQSVPGLHVVVDELSEAASACGISGASIESAAAHTLRAHGIRVVRGSASPYSYLYIAAKVAPGRAARAAQSDCVVDTRVEVIEVSPTQKPVGGFKGPKPVRGMVEAVRCSIEARRSGSPPELQAQFARELEQRIELCLDRLT
jgi:hypothetical protein